MPEISTQPVFLRILIHNLSFLLETEIINLFRNYLYVSENLCIRPDSGHIHPISENREGTCHCRWSRALRRLCR